MATIDVQRCVITNSMVYLIVMVYQRCDIHIGVGFCVARSDRIGQCEGLYTWNG